MKIKVLDPRLHRYPIEPSTPDAAGIDLRACIDTVLPVPEAGTVKVPTGLAVAIPKGWVGLLFGRSGLGVNHQVRPANCVGVIDADYRGEIIIGLENNGLSYLLQPMERIAQLVIVQHWPMTEIELVNELPLSERGALGLGSTGRL
jgi:dUTP pyrophosphatase